MRALKKGHAHESMSSSYIPKAKRERDNKLTSSELKTCVLLQFSYNKVIVIARATYCT